MDDAEFLIFRVIGKILLVEDTRKNKKEENEFCQIGKEK